MAITEAAHGRNRREDLEQQPRTTQLCAWTPHGDMSQTNAHLRGRHEFEHPWNRYESIYFVRTMAWISWQCWSRTSRMLNAFTPIVQAVWEHGRPALHVSSWLFGARTGDLPAQSLELTLTSQWRNCSGTRLVFFLFELFDALLVFARLLWVVVLSCTCMCGKLLATILATKDSCVRSLVRADVEELCPEAYRGHKAALRLQFLLVSCLGSWPLFLETSFPAIKDNTDDMSLVNVFIYMFLHVFTFPIGRILSCSGQQHLAAGGYVQFGCSPFNQEPFTKIS